ALLCLFFFQAEDGIRDFHVTGVQTCALPIYLSEEPLEENIEICAEYLKRMSKMNMTLEIELGCTGGEEDGVDNTDMDQSDLYTRSEERRVGKECRSRASRSVCKRKAGSRNPQ